MYYFCVYRVNRQVRYECDLIPAESCAISKVAEARGAIPAKLRDTLHCAPLTALCDVHNDKKETTMHRRQVQRHKVLPDELIDAIRRVIRVINLVLPFL